MGEGGARTHCKLVKRAELTVLIRQNFFFCRGLPLYGIVAEWSKATALGAVLARGAGSNPADITNHFLHFSRKAVGFFVAIKNVLDCTETSLPSSAGSPGDAGMWTLRCSGQCSAAPSPQCLGCVHPTFLNQGVHERRRAVLWGASKRCRGARRGARSFQEIGDALQIGLAPSSHSTARSGGAAALLRSTRRWPRPRRTTHAAGSRQPGARGASPPWRTRARRSGRRGTEARARRTWWRRPRRAWPRRACRGAPAAAGEALRRGRRGGGVMQRTGGATGQVPHARAGAGADLAVRLARLDGGDGGRSRLRGVRSLPGEQGLEVEAVREGDTQRSERDRCVAEERQPGLRRGRGTVRLNKKIPSRDTRATTPPGAQAAPVCARTGSLCARRPGRRRGSRRRGSCRRSGTCRPRRLPRGDGSASGGSAVRGEGRGVSG